MQWFEIYKRTPGVVHHGGDAGRLGRGGDCRHVLHLERERARGFGVDQARVIANQVFDAGTDRFLSSYPS